MKKKLIAAKNFVERHKTGIAVVGTAAAATYIHIRVIAEHNEFLEKKGLLEEYYHMDEED